MASTSCFASRYRRFAVLLSVLILGLGMARAALPSGWSNADIGTVGAAGGAEHDGVTGTYTLQGSGAGDIGGTADNFHFVYRSLSGDGCIVARIASLSNTNSWAKAGVMLRETTAANAKHALMMVTPGSGAGIKYRTTTGGNSTQVMVAGAAPRWLKLERRGNMVTGFESADGVTWNVVQRIALPMGSEVLAGLVACSRTSGLATVTADEVVVDSPDSSLALPWPWTEQTVGAPADAGVALFDGSFVLSNLGADIAGTADKLKYVSRRLVGDGTLTVKVAGVTSGDNSSRLGLMMRDSLDANSRNVLLGLTTSRSVVFQSRRTVGGATASRATAVTVAVPAWLRLQRQGNVFTAWRSADGVTWTEHGSETLDLPPALEVGLAYSNRHASTWAIGIGDDLVLTTPADLDGNGLADDWENLHFGAAGVDPAADPDGDGLTNAQEWELGADPMVFTHGGSHPVIEQVGAAYREGLAGAVISPAPAVRVKDSLTGDPLAGVPVHFWVSRGDGRIGSAAPGVLSLNVLSDSAGLAQAPFLLPAAGGLSLLQAGVGGGTGSGPVSYGLEALVGGEPLLFKVAELGAPAAPARVSYSDGNYTVAGATVSDNSGAADNSVFVWRELTGDGYILAKASFVEADSGTAQAGVMMRSSLAANAANISMVATPANGVAFQWRSADGAGTGVNRNTSVSGPVWLLLRRQGDTISGLHSTDGQTWKLRASLTLALGETVKVGLTHGTRTSVYNSAVFEDVRTGPSADAPWNALDIGVQRAAAMDDYGTDSLLVRAGGSDITGNADAFRYVYQPLVGDGRLVARVASQLDTHSSAKSGLMIRESLAAGSRHFMVALSPGSGVVARTRTQTGGGTSSVGAAVASAAPVWLSLERFGPRVSAYASADGVTWTLVGSAQFNPGETPLIGLAVAANNTTTHTETLFDHVDLAQSEEAAGWNGAYYSGASFETPRHFRRDAALDFSWTGGQLPAPNVPAGPFSVRWQGEVTPAFTETYTFATLSQGAVRVIVNGQTVIDRWTPHALSSATGAVALAAGQPVRVVVEYAGDTAAAGRVRLSWSSASQPEETLSLASVRAIDSDDDGMPDAWETAHGLDPHNPADAALDPDGDTLTNLQEYLLGGNPHGIDDRLPGVVLMETWNSIAGATVRDFTKDAKSHGAPSLRASLFSLDAPVNSGNGYGRRIRGYLVPPVTGDYRFHLSADDSAEFWLSPDDSPFARSKVARVGQGSTAHRQFDVRPEQRSALIPLQAGQFYYFEILHKENGNNDHVSAAWTLPGATSPEVIGGAHLALFTGHAGDADGNGLPDAWEAAHGLDGTALPAASRGSYGDADGDRLPNLLEYQLGLDPRERDTDGDGHEDALEVWVASDPLQPSDLGLPPWQLGDVGPVNAPALANRIASDAFQAAGTGTGLAIHKEDNFRFLYREIAGDFELTARIVRPESNAIGLAGLSVRSSLDSHAVSLSLLQSVAGHNQPFMRTQEGGPIVPLPAFTPAFASDEASLAGYWFRARRAGDLVSLFYSADGRSWMLANSRTLPLAESCLVGFALCHNMGPFTSQPDVDVPVRRFEDVRLVTDLAPPASPETVPPEATATVVQTLPGNAAVVVKGQWAADANGIVSQTFTGTLDYAFTVPADGLYRVTFTANSPSNPTASTLFPLEISVDGQRVARADLVLSVGEDGLVSVVTPWLKAGAHTVRLFYDNTLSYRPLRIRSVLIEQLGGADADANGRADWIDARLQALNTLDADDGEVYVSPAGLHGKARHRSLMTLAADGLPVGVNPAPGHGWYADVALSETGPVEVIGDFENAGHVQGVLLSWKALNLLAVSAADFPQPVIRIRKGDSLRLTAHPAEAEGGSAVVTVSRTGAEPVVHALPDPVGQPVAHTFEAAGTYTLSASYAAEGDTAVAPAFTVEVIEAAFASDPVVGLNNTPVTWDNPLIFDDVLIEIDQGLLLVKQGDLPAGGSRFALSSSNVNDSYIVARLGEDGPVFGHATVRGMRVATQPDTALDILQVYPDGSRLIGVPIIVNNLTDDTRVEVEIFVQGVTFDDGTIVKILTKADFDEYGRVYLKFLYPVGVDGSICHRVHVYEGQTYLGKF